MPMATLPSGAALPMGHADDVYYAGLKAHDAAAKVPTAYRYGGDRGWTPAVDLSRRYPELKTLSFQAFHSGVGGGELSASGQAAMKQLLHDRFGAAATLRMLGKGAHQVAWRVCAKGKACTAVKIRKLPRSGTAAGRQAAARDAAAMLRRDLAMQAVAEQVTERGLWLDAAGKALPLRIDGQIVEPARSPAGPPGRLARTARLLNAAALADGIFEEELVSFPPSAELNALFERLAGPDGALRDKAWAEAPKVGINRVLMLGFLDRHESAARIGPEVRRLASFTSGCKELAKVPTVAAFCLRVRQEFRIPDDFEQRLIALEQLYRDSAGAVIRFSRANFKRIIGNQGMDGVVREIGLDYNHGANAGWDPQTGQFVLFDW